MDLPYKGFVLSEEDIQSINSAIDKAPIEFTNFFNVTDAALKPSIENYGDFTSIIAKLTTFAGVEFESYKAYTVEYSEGSYTYPHSDKCDYTLVTVTESNYTGGELFINGEYIELAYGETVMFKNGDIHSVEPIEEGNRRVLVVWLWSKK